MARTKSIPGAEISKGRCAVARQCRHCGLDFVATNAAQFWCSVPCRFWSKVEKRAPEECWPWIGKSRHPKGYGSFDKLGSFASRVAYILTYGKIDDRKLFVCHKCDNPVCCNPFHLFLGTPAENTADAIAKHRRVGERAGKAVLTDTKVRELRERLAQGELPRELAFEFGVERTAIKAIKAGKAWPHVTGGMPVTMTPEATARMKRRVLELQVAGIRSAAERRRAA